MSFSLFATPCFALSGYNEIIQNDFSGEQSAFKEGAILETPTQDGYLRITHEYDPNNKVTIIRGYVDDALTEIDHIYDNDTKHVHVQKFQENNLRLKAPSIQKINESIVEEEIISVDSIVETSSNDNFRSTLARSARGRGSSKYLGKIKINLKSNKDLSYTFSGREIISSPEKEQYTINNYVGSLVSLVSILIGAINPPAFMAKEFFATYLSRVIIGVGGYILGDQITKKFSTTVKSEYRKVTIKLKGKSGSYNLTGGIYNITDTKSSYKGKTYIEPYTSRDWGKRDLAEVVISHFFGNKYVKDYNYEFTA